MGEEVEQTNEQYIQEMITRKGIQEGAFTDKELYNLKLFSENYFELRDYNIELQENLYKEKEKNNTLEKLLQGNLYEMYLYYKEVASRYQASCISKETIKDKIKELVNKNQNANETEAIFNIKQQQVLQELLNEARTEKNTK